MKFDIYFLAISALFWFYGIVELWLYNKGYGKPMITFVVNYKKTTNKTERKLLLMSIALNLGLAAVFTLGGLKFFSKFF